MSKKETHTMPTDEGLPAVGDVITSPRFAFANRGETGNFLKIVNVNQCSKFYIALQKEGYSTQRELCRNALGIDAYDKSRADAEFVVEEARWSDNPVTKSTAACSSRWYIAARRMNKDGSCNQSDERIVFFLCGLPDTFVLFSEDIQIIGTFKPPKKRAKR